MKTTSISKRETQNFQKQIWDFYDKKGRHNLPWRKTSNPYHILVSEIMLQQTQVARVLEKYSLFIKKYPTVKSLANASVSDILEIWIGLGYNRRALSLKRGAEKILIKHKGIMPKERYELEALPGIGPYTAGAIRAFAFNLPEIFIETNIRRVYIHHFFKNKKNIDDKEIIPIVHATLAVGRPREWYWALMDYGAHVPKFKKTNPNTKSKHYVKQSKFDGSKRQLRGNILKLLQGNIEYPIEIISKKIARTPKILSPILDELTDEGFIEKKNEHYYIKK